MSEREHTIETLWEITTPTGLFAEAFRTTKGTFIQINKKGNTVILEQEDIVMLLKTLKNYEKKNK